MAYGNFRAFGNNRGGRAPSPGSSRDLQRRNAIKNGGRHPLISNRGFVVPPTFWWTGTEYDETYTQLENISAIETTFNVVLTTNPTLSAPANGAFKGISYPEWQSEYFTNTQQTISSSSRFSWNTFLTEGDAYKQYPTLAITVSSPVGQLAMGKHDYATMAAPDLVLHLKRGRRYRFDLSSPTLSVNPFNPFALNYPGNDNSLRSNSISALYEEPCENKFFLFEHDTTFRFKYDENGYISFTNLRGLSSDNHYVNFGAVNDQLYFNKESFGYMSSTSATLPYPMPGNMKFVEDGNTTVFKPTWNYNIDELYNQNKFIDDESVIYNGIPGTSGAYMDIIIHDGYPDSFTIFNSAYPSFMDNTEVRDNSAVAPPSESRPDTYIFGDRRLDNYRQYITRLNKLDLTMHKSGRSKFNGFITDTGTGMNYAGVRIKIQTYETDDVKIAGDFRPKNVADNFKSIHSTLSTNFVGGSATMSETFRTPAKTYFSNVSAPGYLVDKLILCDKWKDTRTRTITALVEKVFKKLNTNNPRNTISTLSSFDLDSENYNTIQNAGSGYVYRGNKGDPGLDANPGWNKLSYSLFSSYQRPFLRNNSSPRSTGDYGKPIGWNPNFWGYNCRDHIDFSGVCVRYDEYAGTNQGILLTPRHLFVGAHWSSKIKVGDKARFVEKNTGKLVSAEIVQIVCPDIHDGVESWTTRSQILSNHSVLSGITNFAFGNDIAFCKLSRDVTLPDPDVPGSDGSVKPIKIPYFEEPMWHNDLEDMYPKNVPHSLSGNPIYNKSYKNVYSTNDLRWQLSGGFIVGSLPAITLEGLGQFGAYANGSRWGSGDDHAKLFLTTNLLKLDVYKYSKVIHVVKGGSVDVFTNFPSGSGVYFNPIISNNQNQPYQTVSEFHLLSSNPYLQFEHDALYRTPLKLNDASRGYVLGDSNNPTFLLVETSTDELQLVGPVQSNSSSNIYDNSNLGQALSANFTYVYNAIIDSMSGGNPEGFTLSSVRIT